MHTDKKYISLLWVLCLASSLLAAAHPVHMANNSMRTSKIVASLCTIGAISSVAAAYYMKKKVKHSPQEQKGKLKTKKLILQYIALACAFGTLFSINRLTSDKIAAL